MLLSRVVLGRVLLSRVLHRVGCADRQSDGKGSADSEFAVDLYFAVVVLDDAVGNGEPEACSLTNRLSCEERIKQLVEM